MATRVRQLVPAEGRGRLSNAETIYELSEGRGKRRHVRKLVLFTTYRFGGSDGTPQQVWWWEVYVGDRRAAETAVQTKIPTEAPVGWAMRAE